MAAAVTHAELDEAVARHFRLRPADLDARDVHAHRLLPATVARRLHVLPLRYADPSTPCRP